MFTIPWVAWEVNTKGTVKQIHWLFGGGYNAPHYILMALAIFVLFEKYIQLPSGLANVVARVSPMMFGVLHASS